MSKPKRVRINPLPAGERYAPRDKQGLNSQKDFILTELLAVMAIIGILAAVVFSNVEDSNRRARSQRTVRAPLPSTAPCWRTWVSWLTSLSPPRA